MNPTPFRLTQDHLDAYRSYLERKGLSAASVNGYLGDLTQLVLLDLPLTATALDGFVHARPDGTPFATRTSNRRLASVRGLIRFLQRERLLTENPAEDIKARRPPRSLHLTLGQVGLQVVLQAERKRPVSWLRERNVSILKTFFYTGLRLSELQALDVDQVDFAAGVLHTVARKGREGEGGSFVILSDLAADTLRAWLRVRPSVTSPALFPSKDGNRLAKRSIQKTLKQMGEAAQLPIPLSTCPTP